MTTGIRPSSFRPGASSGGVIATNVRSTPQFSNVVVPRRGVVTHNPAAGAGSVGAGIAQRISQMGQDVGNFWFGQAKVAADIGEIDHQNALVEIEKENLAQRRKAVEDESLKPGGSMKGHQWENDLDYTETRLQIRAGIQAGTHAVDYVSNQLPLQMLVDTESNQPINHIERFALYASEQVQGMSPAYKPFYLASLTKAVTPHIEEHLAGLHVAETAKQQRELSHSIRMDATLTPLQALSPGNVSQRLAQADVLLPPTFSSGQRKAWVIEQTLTGLLEQSPPQHENVTLLMKELESNPELGDGTKTFSDLFPSAFQDLAKNIGNVTNEAYAIQAGEAVTQIKSMRTALSDPRATSEDKNQIISDYLKLRSTPHIEELLQGGSDGLNTAVESMNGKINSLIAGQSDLRAVQDWFSGGPYPDDTALREADQHYAQRFGAADFTESEMADTAQFFSRSNKNNSISNTMKAALANRDVSANPNDETNAALPRALRAFQITRLAESSYGYSDSKIRDALGDQAYQIYDMANDLASNGASLEEAIISANARIAGPEFATALDANTRADSEQYLRAKFGGDGEPAVTTAAAVKEALGAPSGTRIDGVVVENFVTDFRRNLVGTDVSDTDAIAETVEKTAAAFNEQYVVIPDGDKKAYMDKGRLSLKQRRLVTPVIGASGEERVGVDELSDNYRALTSPLKRQIHMTPVPSPVDGPKVSGLEFLLAITGDDPAFSNIADLNSRNNGSFPMADVNGQMAIIGPNQEITFRRTFVNERGGRQDEEVILSVVPDSAIASGALDEKNLPPFMAIQQGGVIGWSAFKDQFDSIAGPHGFELMERNYHGQTAYSIEYVGRIPTNTEIEALRHQARLDKEAAHEPVLTFNEQAEANMLGVEPNLEALAEAKRQKQFYGKKQRWILNNNFFGAIIGSDDSKLEADDPEAPWNLPAEPKAVPKATNNNGGAALDSAVSDGVAMRYSDGFNQTLRNAIGGLQVDGQVSPTVGVTSSLEEAPIEGIDNIIASLSNRVSAEATSGVPNAGDQDQSYIQNRNKLIHGHEGLRFYSYEDTSGNPTAGLGFNLNDPRVKELVVGLIGNDKYRMMIADASKRNDAEKRVKLTQAQIDHVYERMILDKETDVSNWYKGIKLTPSQRMVIVDLAYNGGSKLVGPQTNFFQAVKSGDWIAAITEVESRSNLRGIQGVQSRMTHNAAILRNVAPPVKQTSSWSLFSQAHAGTVEAAIYQENLYDSIPTRKEDRQTAWDWMTETWDGLEDDAGELIPIIEARLTEIGVNTALGIARSITPTDSSFLLVSDVIAKNFMGLPVDQRVFTEGDLSFRNLGVLRVLAKSALAKGQRSIEWSDYGNDINGVPIAAIVGYKQGRELANSEYPRTIFGTAKLGAMTVVDPMLDVALTIGGASISTDDDGNIILTDTYDAQKFAATAAGDSAYTELRNFVQENGITLETEGSSPIRWRINLGKIL